MFVLELENDDYDSRPVHFKLDISSWSDALLWIEDFVAGYVKVAVEQEIIDKQIKAQRAAQPEARITFARGSNPPLSKYLKSKNLGADIDGKYVNFDHWYHLMGARVREVVNDSRDILRSAENKIRTEMAKHEEEKTLAELRKLKQQHRDLFKKIEKEP